MTQRQVAVLTDRDLIRELSHIEPLDAHAMQAARARLDSLTKPQGSLGKLELLAEKLAGITRTPTPRPGRKVVLVMAADHGVALEGVSAYPQQVTAQMVANFARGGAAINVLARHVGAEVIVADVGVCSEIPHDGYVNAKICRGTQNITKGAAMTIEQAHSCILTGATLAAYQIDQGASMVATGEMGIGNTTASTAILCAITGRPVEEVTGRGTGIDDSALARKVAAIEQALEVNSPSASDPLDILVKVGGLEIGAIAGCILGCAKRRVPVVVDGFISTVAACLASMIAPSSVQYMIGSHLSCEPGHRVSLEFLGVEPLMSLDMRLGEGTGAVLAMSIADAAMKILNEMATFEEAGVSC